MTYSSLCYALVIHMRTRRRFLGLILLFLLYTRISRRPRSRRSTHLLLSELISHLDRLSIPLTGVGKNRVSTVWLACCSLSSTCLVRVENAAPRRQAAW